MRELWRVYTYACGECGQFLAEPRVPSNCSVEDYRPDGCFKCGSTNVTYKEKGK